MKNYLTIIGTLLLLGVLTYSGIYFIKLTIEQFEQYNVKVENLYEVF